MMALMDYLNTQGKYKCLYVNVENAQAARSNVEKGMIPMGIQHRGHEIEGQIDIKSRFHELFFLDVTQGTPFLTDLSQYDLSKYETITY